ncbi:translation initiation factor IF-2 [Candidatus Micrarchaeota archaeon]|nr:translation initiation factor IF-2 [Candidatus Micrarchaeota archaeon]
MLRQPIISMLAHVDHGKTSILDKIRQTVVAQKEAGAITQHVSASEVPIEVVKKICRKIIERYRIELKIPGLLFIDLPGHEAFTSLRERSGALADLGVLVIDVMQGIQNQTVESINILKQHRVPFVVAANKIDLIEGWVPQDTYSFTESFNRQNERTKRLLDERLYEIIGRLAEYGFNAERFDRITDPTKQVMVFPLSAKTGEGLAEFLLYIAGLSQKYLEENLKLEVSGPAKGSILEVKEDRWLGTTVDAIIYDGTLRKGDTIMVVTLTGTKKVKVRGLFKPVLPGQAKGDKRFINIDKAVAAAGVKILAADIEDVVPGSPFSGVDEGVDEKELSKKLYSTVNNVLVKSEKEGVIIKADTLGSAEALLKLFNNENIPVRSVDIGKVTKKDVIEAESVRDKDKYLGVVVAFNVGVTEDARETAKKEEIPIIESNVVYDLVDRYKIWVKEEKEREKRMLEANIQWPAKIKVLSGCCFRVSKPAVFGIEVIGGKIKPGYTLMTEDGKIIGKIKGIQSEGNSIQEAVGGMQVAISMDDVVFGKDVTEDSTLYSYIPLNQIRILTERFGTELNEREKDILKEVNRILLKLKLQV